MNDLTNFAKEVILYRGKVHQLVKVHLPEHGWRWESKCGMMARTFDFSWVKEDDNPRIDCTRCLRAIAIDRMR